MHSIDRQLIRFNSIDEITARPTFQWEVAADTVTPKEAVGVYTFPKEAFQPCGLSNCRTPHGKGFLVAMDNGHETLVGCYCGAKKMGLAFQEVINRARRADRMSRYREALRQTISSASEFDTRLNALLDRGCGARWLDKRMRECSNTLPAEALQMIGRMARHNTPDVVKLRQMTAQEVAIARQTNALPKGERGPHFREEKVGSLAGLDIWNNDLRSLIFDDLRQRMDDLLRLDVDGLTSEAELRNWAKWAESIPSKFDKAERLLQEGIAFFAPSNIRLLSHLSTAERPIKGLDDAIERMVTVGG